MPAFTDIACRSSWGRIGLNCHAQQGTIDKQAAADAFDMRLFAAAPGRNLCPALCGTTNADIWHGSEAEGLAMQRLVTAEMAPEDTTLVYSFRLGVKYRIAGRLLPSGYCRHAVARTRTTSARLRASIVRAAVSMALSKDRQVRGDPSVIDHDLERNKPDDRVGGEATRCCPAPTTDFPVGPDGQPCTAQPCGRPQRTRGDQHK